MKSLSIFEDFKIQAISLFLISTIYAFLIGRLDVFQDHILTIFYVLYLSGFFLFCAFKGNEEKKSFFFQVLILTTALHAGLLLGYVCSGAGYELLWLDDAVLEHVPKSQEVEYFFKSIATPETVLPGYYRTSHFLTGLLFLIQESPLMSGLSMYVFKLLCTLGIFRLAMEVFDRKVAYVSALLYTLSPSIIFYSFAFYKDAAVQFWYVCFLYLFYLVAIKKQYKLLPLTFLVIFILGMERNYVAVSLMPSIALFVITGLDVKKWVKAIILIAICTTFYFIREKYINFIALDNIVKAFVDYRSAYNRHSDINPVFNSDLPYVLAWIKLYLTPIIAPAKFRLFFDYSILLTWGSFVHQVTMLFFTIGAYFTFKKDFQKAVFYLLPFFIFMCAFAYISPFSGRVRNSYYPMIAIFAGYGFTRYLMPKLQKIRFFN